MDENSKIGGNLCEALTLRFSSPPPKCSRLKYLLSGSHIMTDPVFLAQKITLSTASDRIYDCIKMDLFSNMSVFCRCSDHGYYLRTLSCFIRVAVLLTVARELSCEGSGMCKRGRCLIFVDLDPRPPLLSFVKESLYKPAPWPLFPLLTTHDS